MAREIFVRKFENHDDWFASARNEYQDTTERIKQQCGKHVCGTAVLLLTPAVLSLSCETNSGGFIYGTTAWQAEEIR
jgi:hypothetical protein